MMKNKNSKNQGPKNASLKISANEINRFVYCPYQWYYSRYYGQKDLKERYKALKDKNSQLESNFKKGLRFHKNYYLSYRFQKCIRWIIALTALGFMIWVVIKCR